MPRRYDRFWLHDTLGAYAGVHVWRASMGADPYTHTFYVRLIQVPLGGPQGRTPFEQACRQAVLCRAIRHPHVLQVYGWGEADGMGWLAVEHVEGYDVAALVQTLRRQRLRIPVPLAVHIAMQVLRGLDYLHQHRIVHGGVHEGSVFLGSGNHVKLATPAGDAPFGLHTLRAAGAAAGDDTDKDVQDVAGLLQSLLAAKRDADAARPAPLMPAVPASVAWVLRRARATGKGRWADAAIFYRYLAACEVADPMTGCAPLLRYWVQTAAHAGDVAEQAGPTPAWAQAPMRALFGAPKQPARRKSLLRRIIRV